MNDLSLPLQLSLQHSIILQPKAQYTLRTMLQQQTHYFCYFDIRNQQQLLTVSILSSLLLIVCVVALKKYYQIWRVVINRSIRKIFAGIFIWWVTYLIKDLLSIVLYILYSNKQQEDSYLSYVSKIMFSVDWFSAYIMQSLLIYVSYQWMKRISETFSTIQASQSQSGSRIQQQNFLSTSTYNGIEAKLYPKIKIYLMVRVLSILLLISFLLLSDFNTVSLICKIMLSLLLVDSAIIVCILAAGIYSLKTSTLLKEQIDEEESTRLKNQYIIMIICSIFRFLLDSYLMVQSATQNLTDQSCKFGIQFNITQLLIQVATCLFGHYLPVFIILRIYTLQQKPEDLSKSLLIAAQD